MNIPGPIGLQHIHLVPGIRMDPGIFIDENQYGYHDYDDDWDDEDEDDLEEEDGLDVESDDSLLNLLAENREYLKKGDYRLLYGVMEKCGYEPEEDEEPFFI